MHLLRGCPSSTAGGVLHRGAVMARGEHHPLLLQVFITLRLPELNDVVLPLATCIVGVDAFLEAFLASVSSACRSQRHISR